MDAKLKKALVEKYSNDAPQKEDKEKDKKKQLVEKYAKLLESVEFNEKS